MMFEFDHVVVQWVTTLSSLALLIGGVIGVVFAFYRYIRKDIDSRIDERFKIIEQDLARHIKVGEADLLALNTRLSTVEDKIGEVVNNYKKEFKEVHTGIGSVNTKVDVIDTKLDMFLKYYSLNKEE